MVFATGYTAAAAALLSTAAAQQFVMYTPGGDDTAVERIDPILAPGSIGQHTHQVFGSNALAPLVTYESLRADTTCTTVADASNNGNADDGSIYWHPALYMEAASGSGYIRVPTNGHKLYYKDAGSDQDKKADPFEFPHGFRMLAGNPFMREAATDLQQQNITQWICHADSGMNQGTSGGFPTGVTDCTAVDGFNGAIHFPHCWNGAAFNPAAPTAHVVYPTGDIENGVCPSSHPTRLPHIFMENTFNLDAVVNQVKPNTFVLAQGDNTGYGWHADFFNGWADGAIPNLLSSCPQGAYGNEDIGSCPDFHKGKPASSCKLPTTFKENVSNPPKYLPGCNPILDTNPAPLFAVAPLGVSSNQCQLAGAGGGSSSSAVAPTSTYHASSVSHPASTQSASTLSHPVSSASHPASSASSYSAHTTTLATHVSSSSVAPAHTSSASSGGYHPGSSVSCPGANGQTYTAANGKTFEIECGVDHVAGNLFMVGAENLSDCIAACSKHPRCVDVSLSGHACYMKKTLGAAVADGGIAGAKLIHAGASAAPATTQVANVPSVSSVATIASAYNNKGHNAGGNDVVYTTEVVYVTVTGAPPQPSVHARHARAHLAKRDW